MVGLNTLSLGKGLGAKLDAYTGVLAKYGIVFDGLFSNGIMPDREFALIWMALLIVFVIKAPTTHDLFPNSVLEPEAGLTLGTKLRSGLIWKSNLTWEVATGLLIFLSLQQFSHGTPFLYFQF
jgi:hypothetical protein